MFKGKTEENLNHRTSNPRRDITKSGYAINSSKDLAVRLRNNVPLHMVRMINIAFNISRWGFVKNCRRINVLSCTKIQANLNSKS